MSKFNYSLLICCFLSLLSGTVKAQIPNISQKIQKEISASVIGSIHDSLTGEPLEFGSVMLVEKSSQKEYALNSDSLGKFVFKDLKPGIYSFLAFYAGYPKLEKEVQIVSANQIVDLGKIFMKSEYNTLKEVKIVSFRELVESRPDGIVYNADKDGSNVGTTADEVLRKVPMLTVDLDGNVQMRGNSNIKVLIDGKPSTIIASSVKDALKQIPSDNIKSVEVITSPGAKYDAEGTAGVINIITKKNIIKGMNGMVYASPNYKFKQEQLNYHLGGSLNYRNNKLGISTNFGGGSWSNYSESNGIRTTNLTSGITDILKQNNTNNMSGYYIYGGLSADYQIDSLSSVAAGFNVNPGKWKTKSEQQTLNEAAGVDYLRKNSSESPSNSYSVNATYNKKFKNNPKQTLDILALYSVNKNDDNYYLFQRNNLTDLINYQEKNSNLSFNKELTGQIDYALPLKKWNQKLEVGAKYINRSISSDYQLFNANNADPNSDFILDPNRSNLLNYTQQVTSAYAQFTTDLAKNLTLIAGLRDEYTHISGHLRDNGGDFKSPSNQLLPNAILAYNLPNFHKLKLSYNQRIQRPSINYINPYINYSDPYNITQGNPELKPELIHNVELGYSAMLGKSTINLTTFMSRSNSAIEAITTVGNDGISRTTYQNLAENTTWGANFYGATRLWDKWMINISANTYYKDLHSPSLNIKNGGFQFDGHLYTSVNIYNNLTAEGFGMYRGSTVTLQGSSSGYYYYRLGLKQTLFNGKGNLTLGVENIFTPFVKMTSTYEYQNAIYTTESKWYGRGIRIGFNYRFGKMSFSGPKKSIDNDDLKSGGDSQGGADQMGGR